MTPRACRWALAAAIAALCLVVGRAGGQESLGPDKFGETLTPDSFAWPRPIGPRLADLDGRPHRPLDPGDDRATVLIFTARDCPISNNYAPKINATVADLAGKPVRFYLVHVDRDTTPEAAREHAEQFGYTLPVLIDRDRELVRRTGVAHTPEAAVILRDGSMAYRGRIDDLYAGLTRKRTVVTTDELRDAIGAALEGRRVAVPRTEAVGCSIPDL